MLSMFFNIPLTILENADRIPGGYDAIRLIFGRDLVGRSHVAENWDHYALITMHAFLERSFRYRATPYFKYLMKAFRNQYLPLDMHTGQVFAELARSAGNGVLRLAPWSEKKML